MLLFSTLKAQDTPFIEQGDIKVEFPFIIIQHIPFTIDIEITDPDAAAALEGNTLRMKIGPEYNDIRIQDGIGTDQLYRTGKDKSVIFMR